MRTFFDSFNYKTLWVALTTMSCVACLVWGAIAVTQSYNNPDVIKAKQDIKIAQLEDRLRGETEKRHNQVVSVGKNINIRKSSIENNEFIELIYNLGVVKHKDFWRKGYYASDVDVGFLDYYYNLGNHILVNIYPDSKVETYRGDIGFFTNRTQYCCLIYSNISTIIARTERAYGINNTHMEYDAINKKMIFICAFLDAGLTFDKKE